MSWKVCVVVVVVFVVVVVVVVVVAAAAAAAAAERNPHLDGDLLGHHHSPRQPVPAATVDRRSAPRSHPPTDGQRP